MRKLLLLPTLLLLSCNPKDDGVVSTFEECVAAGNPVLESYPELCRHGGKNFSRDIGNEFDKLDLVRSQTPRPGDVISSPLTIEGEARGQWFFEATFPLELQDADGNSIEFGYVEAQLEWMTRDFVPYKGVLEWRSSYTGKANLYLRKSNASGLPEHDDFLQIPVVIAP